MIYAFLFTGLAALLLLLLFFVGRGTESADDFYAGPCGRSGPGRQDDRCPPELVPRIFSRDDLEFISRIGSAKLLRAYQTERTKVAMHWVRQTTISFREIMHKRALASWGSPNLEVSRELKLFFRYVELRVFCGVLILFLRLAGLSAVGSLAIYASQISHSVARAQRALTSAEHNSSPESRTSRLGQMSDAPKLVTLNDAYRDLLSRTLSKMPSDLGCLIYLSSTRDYNSGAYHHEGLSMRYPVDEARAALQTAHREVFWRVCAASLEDLDEQLEVYMRMSRESPEEFTQAWQDLESYRIAIPRQADSTMVQLFLSNIRVALGVLRLRQSRNLARPSDASQLRSLVQ